MHSAGESDLFQIFELVSWMAVKISVRQARYSTSTLRRGQVIGTLEGTTSGILFSLCVSFFGNFLKWEFRGHSEQSIALIIKSFSFWNYFRKKYVSFWCEYFHTIDKQLILYRIPRSCPKLNEISEKKIFLIELTCIIISAVQ